MTATATMILTRSGTILPLDQRRRDALANYAEHEARAAGVPLQTWVRNTWGLKDYEAKDLIKGNASETVWERILKQRDNPHGGWAVALPVIGAVIGLDLDEAIKTERRKHVELARRGGALGRDLRAVGAVRRLLAGEPAADGRRQSPSQPGGALSRRDGRPG